MPKFDQAARLPATTGPVQTTAPTLTHEGGAGWNRDTKSELFLLAVANMVGEDTFYENAKSRDDRFTHLIHTATAEDPDWTARLIRWLRADANMRSASVVAAAEYAKAGGPGARKVIDSALQRPDEPGEFVAYWHARHGRTLAGGKQRGIADALVRLVDERSALKYDGQSLAYRLGDLIDLAHPVPKADWQADLFKWLLDRRHDRPDPRTTDRLPLIRARAVAEAIPVPERRGYLRGMEVLERAAFLKQVGATWEWLSGWLQGPMDALAWESIIPSMGYMALLRNLRNFDEAGVSDQVAKQVAERLADPEQVARSRQFPLRFLSAYKAAPSLRWSWPLEQAVQHCLANVPSLPGRTLVLVDLSGSMRTPLTARSTLQCWEAAALFGFALGMRAGQADVFVYGSDHRRVSLPTAGSLLPTVKGLRDLGGTRTWQTLRSTYAGHDRVVILTDEQAHDSDTNTPSAPIYTFNLGGYRTAHMQATGNRVTVGGLTDQGFRMIDMLDRRSRGDWPF